MSVHAGVQTALEYCKLKYDDSDSDSSDCESEYSTDEYSISSGEYQQRFDYQRVIHRHNLLSAFYDDNEEREHSIKLFKDLLDSENERNKKEDSNHNTNSDYNYTHYGNDGDGNLNSDYNEGTTRNYTAEEFLSEFCIGDDELFNEEWKHSEKQTKDLFRDDPT